MFGIELQEITLVERDYDYEENRGDLGEIVTSRQRNFGEFADKNAAASYAGKLNRNAALGTYFAVVEI